MMLCSVFLNSMFPVRHVTHVEGRRAAQITARLLEERFPGMTFGFAEGPDVRHGDCHPSIRDSARSFEVLRLVDVELVLERATNPDALPKWIAFRHRNGGVTAWPDHRLSHIRTARADPDVIEERAIYGEEPTPAEILEAFRVGDITTAAP